MARKHFDHEYKFSGWNGAEILSEKECAVCQENFKPKSGAHKFCSEKCKGKWQYISGRMSTENQYESISGNWRRYFARLVGRCHERENITVEDLLKLFEKQDGKCSLTNLDLTCVLKKGTRNYTNASLDRIIPGGPYDITNVRLVCWRVNWMRSNMSDEELKYWCKKIIDCPVEERRG